MNEDDVDGQPRKDERGRPRYVLNTYIHVWAWLMLLLSLWPRSQEPLVRSFFGVYRRLMRAAHVYSRGDPREEQAHLVNILSLARPAADEDEKGRNISSLKDGVCTRPGMQQLSLSPHHMHFLV